MSVLTSSVRGQIRHLSRRAIVCGCNDQTEGFPAIVFPPVPFAPLEKLPAIDAFVRARPLAWIDDVISEEAQHWAAQRGSPTLIVEVDPAIGLTSDIVTRLEEWATTSLGKVTG